MSLETVLVDLENEFTSLTPNAKSFLASLVARVTALETTIASNTSPLQATFSAISKDIMGTLAAGVSVAASATNPSTLVVAIGNVAVQVTTAFGDVFDEVHGFIEGVEGKTPAAGADAAETQGAAAGAATKNILDAFVDDWKATF